MHTYIHTYIHTVVAYQLERSACNAKSTGSSPVRDSFKPILCRVLEQVLRTQFLCNTTAYAPPRRRPIGGSASDLCALRKALYKYIYICNTLQCNQACMHAYIPYTRNTMHAYMQTLFTHIHIIGLRLSKLLKSYKAYATGNTMSKLFNH